MTDPKEHRIQTDILLAAPKRGYRLLRNNIGVAKLGRRFVAFGVGGKGGSDLIGWREIEITPDMVGSRVAVFCAVECKAPAGRLSKHQEEFLDAVREAGGVAIVARGVEDLG